MKEVHPYQTLLFIAGILLVLSPVVFFMPEDGVKVGGLDFKFLTKENFIHPKKQEKADITNIIADIDTNMLIQEDPLLKHENGSNGDLGAPNGGKLIDSAATSLQMNEIGLKNIHAFFEELKKVASKKEKMSILHYGDSQIEGDRMTGYIRERIQNQFGGNGPGLIPATNVYNTVAFEQAYSENFERYTGFGGNSLKSKKYGAMISVARFTPEYELDSLLSNADTLNQQTGWIEIAPSKSAYRRARTYNNVIMYYNSCVLPTKLNVYQSGALIHQEELLNDGAQHVFRLSFPETPGKLKFEFIGKMSPNICGFSLEGDYGVQVSNIAMRGSSGTVFGRVDQQVLRTMYDSLNTKLVIMQFGGNSVPFFKDSTSVESFTRYFKSQINRIKRLNDNAMVIVIGPSDMSVLEDQIYETYEFLPYCVEQMTKVTKEAGAAYWDLFAAMGGENSMPSWVEKGLAGKDYIHFSNAGSKIASQLFYDAFLAEYSKWEKNRP